MAGQLESHHFFRSGDTVRGEDGRTGTVVDSGPLYATIAWERGDREEVDQFDPRVLVLERAQVG